MAKHPDKNPEDYTIFPFHSTSYSSLLGPPAISTASSPEPQETSLPFIETSGTLSNTSEKLNIHHLLNEDNNYEAEDESKSLSIAPLPSPQMTDIENELVEMAYGPLLPLHTSGDDSMGNVDAGEANGSDSGDAALERVIVCTCDCGNRHLVP